MKNSITKKSIIFALLLITPLLISSCLSGESQVTSRVQVGLEMQNFDDTLRTGQDTLTVNNVRLILGASYFLNSNDDSLYFNQSARQVEFGGQQSQNPALLASGAFPEGAYSSITLTIPKAPEQTQAFIDEDFIEDGKRYTIIVQGELNSQPYTFKSERVFEPLFTFQPAIDVPQYNEAFGFLISSDVLGWFSGNSGILDPTNPDNSTQINDNIEQSFTIDAPE